MTINGTTAEVSKAVAGHAQGLGSLPNVAGLWVGTVGGRLLQLVVATSDELLLVLDGGVHRIPWADITIIGPNGVTTARGTYELDLGAATTETMAWMAEYFCPEARRVSLGQSERHVPYGVRSEEWRRARNRRMTEALKNAGGKWANAMEGSRFNAFSIMGTGDWEDYASASMTAMSLEALTDLGERVEAMEGLLKDIRDLLAGQGARNPAGFDDQTWFR